MNTDVSINILQKPPIGESGFSEWKNNKASASNDGFRWQFAVTNDQPTVKHSGKYGTDSQPKFSKHRETRLQTGDERGRWEGGVVQVYLTGWKEKESEIFTDYFS